MIQAIQNSTFNSFLDLADNRINTSVPVANIKHLFKFSNDFDKAVFYCYPTETAYGERYYKSVFTWNIAPNVFAGTINLKPAGYHKYEVYEVSWPSDCTPVLDAEFAPSRETQVLEGACVGTVNGLIAIGKLYNAETPGSEEVQYIEHTEPVGTNYIYTG